MSDLEVRSASDADLSRLSFDEHLRENSERWQHLEGLVASGRGQLLVATRLGPALGGDEPGIVGYVALASGTFFDRDFVDLLVVAPAARRTGVGRALLNAAVDLSATHTVFTSTNESNAAMRALLDQDGWLVSGILDGLDPGDPEVVYYLPPAHAF